MSLRVFGWPELQFLLFSVRWTILLSLSAFLGGGILGLGVAGLRISPSRVAQRAMGLFITLFQGTPLLVQLLLFYYGASFAGLTPDAWLAAALTFTLNSGAFFGEIWRGCLESIPRGQWDGARALGFGFLPALRLIIFPQAFRIMLAPTIGYMVQVVKSTSVASLIGITELTRTAVMVNTVTFEPARVFGAVCLVYFAICWPLSLLSERLGQRLNAKDGPSLGDLFRVQATLPRRRLAPRAGKATSRTA